MLRDIGAGWMGPLATGAAGERGVEVKEGRGGLSLAEKPAKASEWTVDATEMCVTVSACCSPRAT